jgi:hypothetical protein
MSISKPCNASGAADLKCTCKGFLIDDPEAFSEVYNNLGNYTSNLEEGYLSE